MAGADRRSGTIQPVREIVAFFRENPQVLVLLVICLVLGLGTMLAVVFGLITAGSGQTTGEPSGLIGFALTAR
jgi:hypothetical protein